MGTAALIVALLLAAAPAAGQTPGVTSFAEAEGLLSAHVTSIAQDLAGTLWVGTTGGLFRATGARFAPDPSAPAAIAVLDDPRLAGSATSPVNALLVDRSGALWVASGIGIHRRLVSGTWTTLTPAEEPYDALWESASGLVWAGGPGGLRRWDGAAWHDVALTDPHVVALSQDGQGRIWAATTSGIEILTDDTVTARIDAADLPGDVLALTAGPSSEMWAGTNGGLIRFSGLDVAQMISTSDGLTGGEITSLQVLDGRLWVGTGFGVTTAGVTGTAVTRFTVADGLVDDRVTSLAVDREGNLWVGTRAGLSRVPVRSWSVEPAPALSGVAVIALGPDGDLVATRDGVWRRSGVGWIRIGDAVAKAFARADSTIWLGSEEGLMEITDEGLTAHAALVTPADAVAASASGDLWVGTIEGLVRLGNDGSIDRFDSTNSELPVDAVLAVWPEGEAMWAGTRNGGAVRFGDAQLQIDRELSRGALLSDVVTAGVVDRTGAIWFGTAGGVSRLAPDADPADPTAWQSYLLGLSINAMVEDPHRPGHVWVGSRSGLHLLAAGAVETTFRTNDGLPHATVLSLAWAGQTLWIGTENGLAYQRDAGVPPQLSVVDVTVDGESCNGLCDRPLEYRSQIAAVDVLATDLGDLTGASYSFEIVPAPPSQTPPVGVPTAVGRVTFELEPGTTYQVSVTAADRHLNARRFDTLATVAVAAPSLVDRIRDSDLTLPVLGGAILLLAAWLAWRTFGAKRMRIQYRDALVTIASAGERTLQVALQLEGRPASVPVQVPVDPVRLEALENSLRRATVTTEGELRSIGSALYALMNPAVDPGLQPAPNRRRDYVRIRLRLTDGASAYAGLPWEAVHAGQEHLALTGNIAITRDLATGRAAQPHRIVGAAEMLVVWASPRDMAQVDGIEDEMAAIDTAVKATVRGFAIDCRARLAHATPESLGEALRHGYDIVHFIGHGGFDAGEPAIYLEDRRGDAVPVVADELIIWLRPDAESGRRAPALLVLNACRTADDAGAGGATGMASRLVEAQSILAAVGMGYPIRSSAAAIFAKGFYRSVTWHGQVDRAVADGRRELSRRFGEEARDWCTPRLFLGVPGGVVIDQRR